VSGPRVPDIRTARLDMASMSLAFMRALHDGDLTTAGLEIGASVPAGLVEQLHDFVLYRIPALEAEPDSQPWLGRVLLERGPGWARSVVGTAGFHAPPDADGWVEIGYGVEPDHRRRGLATEAVVGLMAWAREQGVTRFRASVAPTNDPSLAIVRRLGFREVGVRMDEIDGEELVFELDEG
jgi:ribosomal-protein-alanine N-acetyltransferase